MQKRGILFFVLVLLVFSSLSVAQEDNLADSDALINAGTAEESSSDLLQGAVDEYGDAELSDGGTGPGDAFYFVDEVFDNFASDESVTEEKAGEVFAALESGDKDAARQALERYEKYNKKILENADPGKRDILRRNAAAIYNKYNELSEEDKEEFSGVLDGAEEAATAVEISSKIKELCEQLAELDVETFQDTCKTGEDSPVWQQKMFEDLTAEQGAEVEKFVEVIGECFNNPANCNCAESTNIQSFVDQCELISQAEAACREGNDEACDTADEIGENIFQTLEGAPHLQNALQLIERRFSEFEDDRYGHYLPPECEEAGVTDPSDCRKIMMLKHAPEECRSALENVDSEGDARKICEKIMMDKYNPECSEAGITDPQECGKYMFKQNAPPECIDAGLTGEHRDDPKKCEEIMHGLEEGFGEFDRSGSNSGPDCRGIENSEERLQCYDNAVSGVRGHFESEGSFGFPEQCREAGATTPEACGEIMRERFGAEEFRREEFRDGEFNEGEFRGEFRGPPQECSGLSPEECARRFGQEPPSGEFREGQPPSGEFREEFREEQNEDSSDSQSDSSGSSDDSGSNEGSSGSSSGDSEEGGSGEGSITGNVIFSDDSEQTQQTKGFSGFAIFTENNFLRYYYR